MFNLNISNDENWYGNKRLFKFWNPSFPLKKHRINKRNKKKNKNRDKT